MRYSIQIGYLTFYLLISAVSCIKQWAETSFHITHGHYPSSYCSFTDAFLLFDPRGGTTGTFIYRSKIAHHEQCQGVKDIWSLRNEASSARPKCDETFDVGHVFTIYYWGGGSNYFHLHYDMMIPLYQTAHHGRDAVIQESHVFMPSVESSRLKHMDWQTKAFQDSSKYWVEMSKVVAGQHAYRPLDQSLVDAKRTICFKRIHFGTSSVKFDNAPLIRGFISFVQNRLNIKKEEDAKDRIGIVARKSRRRILNENELVADLSQIAPTEVVEFSGRSFAEQVQLMRRYTVLIAVNGAGLTNALYLPPHGVPVQIIPYKADLNFKEFQRLLRTRGEYAEWHNRHENLTQVNAHDKYNNNANTIVHLDEFRAVVQHAMSLVHIERQKIVPHSEL